MSRVVSIQYLRGLAAMLVVIYHIGHIMPQTGVIFPLGTIGIDIFFAISGFIIWVTGRNLTPSQFLRRRLIRLVPLYWAVTLLLALGLLIGPASLDWSKLWHSLAFLAHTPNGGNGLWPKPILSVGWTLNLEVFFYACMALALFAPQWARLAVLTALLGGIVTVGFLIQADAGSWLHFYTSSFMAEFLIGVCLGVLWTSNLIPAFKIQNILLLAACSFILAFMPLEHTNRLVAFGSFVTLLVLLFLMAEPVLRTQRLRFLHALGDASYSLYLTHLPVILGLHALAIKGTLPITGFVLAAFVLAATLIIGFACHYSFERPVHLALSARFRHAKARKSANTKSQPTAAVISRPL